MSHLIYNVEDDASIRELINYALINEGYEAVSFESAEAMLAELENNRIPELIILDIMLPGIDGIEALKLLRAKYKNVNIKIIMLTAKASEINKITGLDSGADDYITKPFSVLELISRVKAHLRKFSVDIDEGVFNFGGLKLNPKTRQAFSGGKAAALTFKEFELLNMLMENAGSVVSREKLLNEVWGYDYLGESRTVDIHIKNLRAKLGKNGDCIVSVRGIGYILKESDKERHD